MQATLSLSVLKTMLRPHRAVLLFVFRCLGSEDLLFSHVFKDEVAVCACEVLFAHVIIEGVVRHLASVVWCVVCRQCWGDVRRHLCLHCKSLLYSQDVLAHRSFDLVSGVQRIVEGEAFYGGYALLWMVWCGVCMVVSFVRRSIRAALQVCQG